MKRQHEAWALESKDGSHFEQEKGIAYYYWNEEDAKGFADLYPEGWYHPVRVLVTMEKIEKEKPKLPLPPKQTYQEKEEK